MKAGLLICDHVNEEYQEEFGDYPDMFRALFPNFEWLEFDVVNGNYPSDVESCDVYFATGSRQSVYEELEWIRKLEEFIRSIYNAKKYFIGVCFGHQIMGKAMGGTVNKSPNGWCVGVHQFNIVKGMNWMIPSLKEIQLLMMCQDQVIVLPEGSKLLASSEMCPNAMFQLGERFLGIQAHPEFSKEYDRLLMSNRIERIGEKGVREGIDSLNSSIDAQVFARWILQFINKK